MNNKQKALDFLNLVVSGKIDLAYEKHVNMKGIHHNIYFPAGFLNLKEAMKDNEVKFPNKKFSVKHVIAEKDFVISHAHVKMTETDPGISVCHIFRFKHGKIIEMWDVGVKLPEKMPNKNGAF